MRFSHCRTLLLSAVVTLLTGGSVALLGAASAAAAPGGQVVHCNAGGNLQAAIAFAAPGATITVDGTCYGNFQINQDLTLVGPATLDGNGSGTVLLVNAGTVALNNLTIQHGNGTNFGQFVVAGGIDNNATLILNQTTVWNNSAGVDQHITGLGGGIVNVGTLTLNRSTVSNNTATDSGGGIFNFTFAGQASLTLNGSTVSDNQAATEPCPEGCGGGGISSGGNPPALVTLNQSTLANNSAQGFAVAGGAINTSGPVTLNGCVIEGNFAFVGGGIFTEAPITINKATASNNRAVFGGALAIFSSTTTVNNSTFTNNPGFAGFDDPAGVFVFPPGFGGSLLGGAFTANHSTFG
jgi:hypothetical protein